jgi:hypothetical protein
MIIECNTEILNMKLATLILKLKRMFLPTKNICSMKRASPPKLGVAEPVNLKTLRNPAKTAQRPFGLVRSRAHFFARISCIFKECASNGLGKWFWCRTLSALPKQKDNNNSKSIPNLNAPKNL